MAVTTANIYRATVYLNTGAGQYPPAVGMPGLSGQAEVVIIAQTPAAAIAILQTQYGAALVNYSNPVLVAAGALTTGTGTLLADETTTESAALEPPHHPPVHDAPHPPARARAR